MIDALIGWAYRCATPAVLAVALAGPAAATEVTLAHGGLRMQGTLELAPGRTLADGVVIMVHGTMAHRDMDIMRHFRQMLGDKGYSTLAVNLSLGVDRREGLFGCERANTHRLEDALEEIGAWVQWAAKQGARRVTLLGHSRGGQQAAWYAARNPSAVLERVVLLAPWVSDDLAGRYAARFGAPLAPLLEKARALPGEALLRDVGFLNCDQTAASAASFVSYYAPAPEGELPVTLPRIAARTLVLVAGGDQVVRDLDKRIAPLVDGKRLQMAVVPGADHFFRDLYGEDAVDAIHEFLQRR